MFPILFQSGSFIVYSYVFMIALSFTVAILVITKSAAQNKLPVNRLVDYFVFNFLIMLLGARLLFVVTHLEFYSKFPERIIRIWEGGFATWGGLLFAMAFSIFYFKKHKLPPLKVLDVASPAFSISQAIAKIGCFGAGCCYGIPFRGPFSFSFSFSFSFNSRVVPEGLRGIPLFPMQLVESLFSFILFVFLWRYLRTKKFDGEVFSIYVLIYSIGRVFLDLLRGDRAPIFGSENFITLNQALFSFTAVVGIIMYTRLHRRSVNASDIV